MAVESSSPERAGIAPDAENVGPAPAAAPADKKHLVGRLLSRVDTDEVIIAVSLVALAVLVRVLWLGPVEIWGDAAQKWHFARQLAYANDFRHADWTHHMARFGVIVPVFLLQRVLSTAPKVYYVVPVAAYALQVLFAYLIARKLSGRAAGIFCAVFLVFFTGMNRSASQLLPDGIAATVLAIATYLWLHFHEADGRRRLHWLLAVSLAFVWAYAIKESNLFFFPALGLCVWLSRRSFKEAAIFSLFVGAYGALETAGFWIFTKYHSRLAIVQDAEAYKPIKFMQLFERYHKLEPCWQMLLWLWVPGALWLMTRRDKAYRPLLLIPLSFLLLLTFLVRHIDPIVPWIGNKSRYLAVIAPFLVLGVGLLAADSAKRTVASHRSPRVERLLGVLHREGGALTLAVCGVLGALTYWHEGKHRFDALHRLRDQVVVLNDAYRRNLPIIDFTREPRALKTIYAVFLRDKLLAQSDLAPEGWLPDINDAVRRTKLNGRQVHYLLLNGQAYGPDGLEEVVQADCYVAVEAGRGIVKVLQSEKLPPACKAPRGEPLPR